MIISCFTPQKILCFTQSLLRDAEQYCGKKTRLLAVRADFQESTKIPIKIPIHFITSVRMRTDSEITDLYKSSEDHAVRPPCHWAGDVDF